jgi:hypothetical protein
VRSSTWIFLCFCKGRAGYPDSDDRNTKRHDAHSHLFHLIVYPAFPLQNQSPRSNSKAEHAKPFLACVSRSASLCQACAISTRKVLSLGSAVVRASCRHRTSYRWQSFATDIGYSPNKRMNRSRTPRPELSRNRIRLDGSRASRFGLQKVSSQKQRFRGP